MEEIRKLSWEALNATVSPRDANRLMIAAWNEESGDGAHLDIALRRYDAAAGEFVDDEATLDKADALLREAFGGLTLKEVLEDSSAVAGLAFEGYLSAEGDRIYLTPPVPEFSPLGDAACAALLDAYGKGKSGGKTTPVREVAQHGIGRESGEPYSMYHFETGVEVEVEGERLAFKVSQVVRPAPLYGDGHDVRAGLRYDDDFATAQFALVDTGAAGDDAERTGKALKIAEKMLARRRMDVVQGFKAATGADIEQLVAAGEGIEFDHVEIGQVGEDGPRFVVCHLARPDSGAGAEDEPAGEQAEEQAEEGQAGEEQAAEGQDAAQPAPSAAADFAAEDDDIPF